MIADGLFLVLVLVLACVLTYFLSRRASERRFANLQERTERQLSALTSAIKNLESELAGVKSAAASGPVAVAPAAVVAPSEAPAAMPREAARKQDITPELLSLITAAVTSFLGKKVRIHSARKVQSPYEVVSSWSQQGRVIVQTSHNLRRN